MITAERTKQIFNSLKLHFTSDYNYILYNGKTRSVKITDKDAYFRFFSGRLISEENVKDFFIANLSWSFINRGKIETFAGNFREKEYFDRFREWRKNQECLIDRFEKECPEKLSSKDILNKYNRKEISLDTFAIIGYIKRSLFEKLIETSPDPFVIPELVNFCIKYAPLIIGDNLNKYKLIMVKKVNGNENIDKQKS